MAENHKITLAASTIGVGTLFSRILGFLRDMVIAHFFGAQMEADAFFVAFRIPNLWRRLVGEGSLTISFIPVYTEYLTKQPRQKTEEFTDVAFSITGLILIAITVLGIVFSPIIIRIIAPGFIKSPEKFNITVTLNQIIFPYLFFMGLFALSMGILNSLRHFFAPAIAPVFLNISIIISVIFFYYRLERPVMSLAIGVLAGGIIQFFFQLPFLIRKGIRFRFNFNFKHPGIKKVGFLMIPGVIGTAVYQINVFVDTVFASFLPGGSISYLYFADRLIEFPLGIFAIAIGMASLPSLSLLASQGKMEELKETISFSFRLVSFISIPSMVGLISLKTPIIHLLFERGLFDTYATQMTAKALLFYSVGLWAIAGSRSLVSAFYSLKDTWTPLKISLICLGANIIFNAILIQPLRHAGLALATSLSSTLNLILIFRYLNLKIGNLSLKNDIKSLIKNLLSSIPTGFIVYIICSFVKWTSTGNLSQKIIILFLAIIIGIFTYLIFSYIFKSEEMFFLLKSLKRGKRQEF